MKTDSDSTFDINSIFEEMVAICGEKYVAREKELLLNYERDETFDLNFEFDILVKPANPKEISSILQLCNKHHIPVTPRGGGSGVSGGALPVQRGVVLSLERLNKILHIHTTDRYVEAEAGVITAQLCEQVEAVGLYFPVIPGSSAVSFIGGNVAENAGSIHSCKFGNTAQYVLNLEVVLTSGEIIWTGANVLKNSTGLNLTQLFVGSEGILGVVTKVVYRLLPKPYKEVSMLAGFTNLESACNAIIAIAHSKCIPSAVELICEDALQITANFLSGSFPLIGKDIKAHLLVSLQGERETLLTEYMDTLMQILENFTQMDVLVADTMQEKEQLWKLRKNIGSALVSSGKKYRDLDICIPLSALTQYLVRVKEICEKYDIKIIRFGHALDGNLHTMLSVDKRQDHAEQKKMKQAVHEIYTYAIENGGVISGEHGIGLLHKEWMSMQFSQPYLSLMKSIKHIFDPNGILNPGKVF